MDKKQHIAIVGMGGIFPGALNYRDFWDNLVAARDLSQQPPEGRWLLAPEECYQPGGPSPDKVYSNRACFVDDFELDLTGLKIDAHLINSLDPMFRLLLHAGRDAWRDAKMASVDPARTGVIIGNIALPTEASSALADEIIMPELMRQVSIPGHHDSTVNKLNRYVTGLPAGLLARSLGLGGGSYTLDAACASSLYALKYAVDELLADRADAMLTGGLSRPDPLYTQMGFSALHALSASGHCSPFDHKADGLVVGEGAGILVLKRLEDALADEDDIYATVEGIGLSNDIGGNLMSPDSEGQLRAMQAAYKMAGWQPWDVDLIECHGTGTPVGDVTEFTSLCTLWEGHPPASNCVIGSVKSNIGHLLTAAGSAGLIKLLLAIKYKTLPPTANFESPNSGMHMEASPFSVLSKPEDWKTDQDAKARRAAISAFGFGGINAHVLIQEWNGDTHIPETHAVRITADEKESDIAIVGMDCHFGPWKDLQAFSQCIFNEHSEHVPRTVKNTWGIETGISGHTIDAIEIPTGRYRIPPTELKDMLPQQLLMLETAANAIDDAGLDTRKPLSETGVYIGIGLDLNTTNFHVRWRLLHEARKWADELGLTLTEQELKSWTQQLRDSVSPPLTANRTMGALGGIVASRIARAFNIGGPGFTVSNEEASGLRALATGYRALQQHDIDSAIIGAVDLASDLRALLGQHDSRPYNQENIVGDGAAALVLKRYEDAITDGDHIYACVRGVGESTQGHPENTVPHKEAYLAAIHSAIANAGTDLNSIRYIDAHGSKDPVEAGMEASALKSLPGDHQTFPPTYVLNTKNRIGHTGAAGGLASLVQASLALHHRIIPAHSTTSAPMYWLRDRSDGPRQALVNSFSIDGTCISAVLMESGEAFSKTPTLNKTPTLFCAGGGDKESLSESLHGLLQAIDSNDSLAHLARKWNEHNRADNQLAVSFIAQSKAQLKALIASARDHVQSDTAIFTQDLFYNPRPSGPDAKIAFVFPGSGNHFQGMGQEAGRQWPEVLNRLDHENEHLASQFAHTQFWSDTAVTEPDHRDVIFGQVWLGTFISDVVASFHIKPDAVIGYSLGETAGLFATRTWVDRDLMLKRIQDSELFTRQLAGNCDAAREVWGLDADQPVDWEIGVVACEASKVLQAIEGREQVYLLIINTQSECVIGGNSHAVQELVKELGCHFHMIEGVTSVHCDVAAPFETPYRDLHLFDTCPPEGISFYSGIHAGPYAVSRESAADSIVGQALHYFDYPKVINSAYDNGVRLFIEMGPGGTCTRMIDQILGQRAHYAKALCVRGQSDVMNVLQLLARFNTERIPFSLEKLSATTVVRNNRETHSHIRVETGKKEIAVPMPPVHTHMPDNVVSISGTDPSHAFPDIVQQMLATDTARAEAQKTFLKVAHGIQDSMARVMALQTEILGRNPGLCITGAVPAGSDWPDPLLRPPRFTREQCMEIAIGQIANVLGEQFAEVDNYPTRVRLPDEPLMLVDRIMELEGEACSMSNGRVVTEHDVLRDAWYLDGGRIPTCIAVEAGQADLFLSGYLGIDHITRGNAVYRLLDAEVTFHGPLPETGQTIQYDIHIDHFFKQGKTYLFRFYFDGTIDGQPFITMRNGCAGFFTQAELDAGQGIVLTSLEKQAGKGITADDWSTPVSMNREAYDRDQVEALRRGDLAMCFGQSFARLNLKNPKGLPGGRMTLVHRILALDPAGGRFAMGQITGEADIQPDDWFLSCHFVDDQVMPGTLMYECCLHTLRIYLLRMGWVAETDEFVYEPIQGITSKLKCRGQVTAETSKVQYEITLKETGYRGNDNTPYVIADALMYADGRPVVQMSNMSLQLTGLTQHRIETLWQGESGLEDRRTVLYDYDAIHAFAVGKPSEAFGDRYRVFDNKRIIARLPGPPFQFLDRIVSIRDCEPWTLQAGGEIIAEYDVPFDAWYFDQGRQAYMPFAVLLEAALQPCGWLAAYLGSALTSDEDLSFRNLGGCATQYALIDKHSGTLTTRVRITDVSRSGGMIIQHFDYHVSNDAGDVYAGNTYFGFFTRAALADQTGIRDAALYEPTTSEKAAGSRFSYPANTPYPDKMLRMIDEIHLFVPDGGPHNLGYIEGVAYVDPDDWFYKAHFYQDPVWPGSLGLESFIQLLKVVAMHQFGGEGDSKDAVFESMPCGEQHQWLYRGQILPTDSKVSIQAIVTAIDKKQKILFADGFLTVDGRIIYQMTHFSLRMRAP